MFQDLLAPLSLTEFYKLQDNISSFFREYLNLQSEIQTLKQKKTSARQLIEKRVILVKIRERLKQLTNLLGETSTQLKNSGHPKEGEKGLKKAAFIFNKINEPIREGGMYNNLAVLYENQARIEDAQNYYLKAVHLFENHPHRLEQNEEATFACSLSGLALTFQMKKNYEKAINYYQKSLVLKRKHFKPSDFTLSKTISGFGCCLVEAGKHYEALEYLNESSNMLERQLNDGQNDSERVASFLASNYTSLAKIELLQVTPEIAAFLDLYDNPIEPDIQNNTINLSNMARIQINQTPNTSNFQILENALNFLKKALFIQETYLQKNKMPLIFMLHKIKIILFELKRYDEAEEYIQRYIQVCKTIDSTSEWFTFMGSLNLADFYLKTSRYSEAERTFKQMLNMDIGFDSECKELKSFILCQLAIVYDRTCRYKESEDFFRRSLIGVEQYFGSDLPQFAEVLGNFSSVLLHNDQFEECESVCKQAITILQKHFGPGSVNEAAILINLACMHAKTENYQASISLNKQVLNVFEQKQPHNIEEIARTISNLALDCTKVGRLKEAKRYFIQALELQEKLYGQEGSDIIAGTFLNYGILLEELKEYDLAIKNYTKAYDILNRFDLFNSTMMAKICEGLAFICKKINRAEEAIIWIGSALKIKRKIFPEHSVEVGETLYNFSVITNNPIGFANAIEHYEQSGQGDCYSCCLSRLDLARSYVNKAVSSTEKKDIQQNYDSAINFYQKNISINHDIIRNNPNEFSSEDLNEHISTLRELAIVFTRNNQGNLAATLFENEAKLLKTSFTQISLFCIDEAIKHYDYLLHTQPKRAELLMAKVQLLNQLPFYLRPWRLILDSLQQALFLNPSLKIDSLVTQSHADYQIFAGNIDPNILFQLEQCAIDYQQLTQQCIFEDDEMSSFVENKISDIVVNMRHILDQYFHQLINRSIEIPQQRELGDLYFPIAYSKNQLHIMFGKQRLLSNEIILSVFDLKIKGPDRQNLGDPPTPETIIQALVNIGYLQKLDDQNYKLNNFKPQNKFIPWDTNYVNNYPTLLKYSKAILKKIKNIYNTCQNGLDTACPNSFNLLVQEQVFTYFHSARNQNQPGIWKDSWILPFTKISDDNKHVRLAPHQKKTDLQHQKGLLKKAKRKIQIRYLDQRFFLWSFVELLSQHEKFKLQSTQTFLQSRTDSERITLSEKLIRTLRRSEHLVKNISKHPLALNYQSAIHSNKSDQEIEAIKLKFFESVKQSIIPIVQEFDPMMIDDIAEKIAEKLLNTTQFQNESTQYISEKSLDLIPFLQRLFESVYGLVSTFAKDISRFPSQISSTSSSTIQSSITFLQKQIEENDKHSNFASFIQDLNNKLSFFDEQMLSQCTWTDISEFYQDVLQLAQHHLRQGQFDMAAKVYSQTAIKLKKYLPHLSIFFLEKSVDALKYHDDPLCYRDTLLTLIKAYYDHNLSFKAMSLIKQILDKNQQYLLLEEDQKVLMNEYNKFGSYVNLDLDKDIYSQLEYARESLYQLHIKWFNYCSNHGNQSLLDIRNHIAQLTIKIRHLLDQGFRRLLTSTVLEPNGVTDIPVMFYNFPYNCKIEKDLKKRLKSCHAIDNPAPFVNLDQGMYDLIKSMQPFSFTASQTYWPGLLATISNHAKHEQLPKILISTQLQQCLGVEIDKYLILEEGNIDVFPLLEHSLAEVSNILKKLFGFLKNYHKTTISSIEQKSENKRIPVSHAGFFHPSKRQSKSANSKTSIHNKEILEVLTRYQLSRENDLPSLETALRRAASQGDLERVKKLISQKSIDINQQDSTPSKRKTALHWAAQSNHHDVFIAMLCAGGDPLIKDASDKNAFDYNNKFKELFEQLYINKRNPFPVEILNCLIDSSNNTAAQAYQA